jgi:flagellar biosynthesis protein FlhB
MSGQEKKHDATDRHLDKSREDGQIASAKDLIHALVVVVLVEMVVLAGGLGWAALDALSGLMFGPLPMTGAVRPEAMLQAGVVSSALIVAPPLLAGAVLTLLSGLLLNRFLFAPKALQPNLERISPLGVLKSNFSGQGLSRFAASMVKLVAFLSLSAWFVYVHRHDLLAVWQVDAVTAVHAVAALIAPVARQCAYAFLVVATGDYALALFWHKRQLRMTDEELKRDHRESEGDPWARAHLAALRRLFATQDVPPAKSRPDVVLANPTHYAIGLVYRRGRDDVPCIVAKRTDAQARAYLDRARRDGVPILRSPAFTRSLYRAGDEGARIPETFLEPVAIVFRIVEALRDVRRDHLPLELDIPADVFDRPSRRDPAGAH